MKWMLGAVLAASLCMAPATASACGVAPGTPLPPPRPDHTERDWAIAFGTVGGINAAIIGVQLATIPDMFPDWAAHLELTLGIAESALASALGVHMFISMSNSCGPGSGAAYQAIATGTLGTVGGWLIAHAIWSYLDVDAVMPQPLFVVDADGAQLGVVGRF